MTEMSTHEGRPMRDRRPKVPLVEAGEARDSKNVDERRYLAAVLSSGGATLDSHALDLDACIGSDTIRVVLRAVEALRREGKPTGQEHVESWIREHADDSAPRVPAINLLSEPLTFADDLEPVVATLRQRGSLRRMRQLALGVIEAANAGRFGEATAACDKLRELSGDAHTEDVAVPLSETMRAALPPVSVPGEPLKTLSPILRFEPLLDDKIRLRRGEVLVLGLATNVGKSTVLEKWNRDAIARGHGTLLISIEDTVELFGNKSLAALAGLDRDAIGDGTLTREEREHAESVIAKTADGERAGVINSRTVRIKSRRIDEVCRWIRRAGAQGCAIVFVDFLQAIKPDRFFRQRKDAVDYCLNEMLAASASANVALIISSQFARREKTAADMKRPPVLADLKESGDIENSATYVVLGWRTRNDARATIFAKIEKNKSKGFLGSVGGWQRDGFGNLHNWQPSSPQVDDDDEGGF